MPGLLDLSTETLCLVFRHLCLHCQGEYALPYCPSHHHYDHPQQQPNAPSWYGATRQELFSLCLVSRRIRDIAQDILYHEFVLDWGSTWRANYSWDGRLASFMRTVSQRRDLADRVRSVSLSWSLLDPIGDDEARDTLKSVAEARDIHLRWLWKQRSHSTSGGERYKRFLSFFLDNPKHYDDGPRSTSDCNLTIYAPRRSWISVELFSLLMSLLPNLEHLRHVGLERRCLWPMMGISPASLHALGVESMPLKSLDLDCHDLTLLRLAENLEELSLHTSIIHDDAPSMPNLKTLRVTDVRLRKNSLEHLLSCCTGALETFVYEAREPIDLDIQDVIAMVEGGDYPGSNHFQPSDAVECLRSHRKSLRTLHLDLRRRTYDDVGTEPICSLKDFTALESLFLCSMDIYNDRLDPRTDNYALADRLPKSLEALYLAAHSQGHKVRLGRGLLGLSNILEYRREQLPNLRSIWCDDIERFEEALMRYRMTTAGVDFGYEKWPRMADGRYPKLFSPPGPITDEDL
ncbi:hypothetical protein EDB80DRAFT_125925 [Ilyonectria destructans]|nr:hypothetical protein EDB80DRAFT_125925 [Ilyonectria destructans]